MRDSFANSVVQESNEVNAKQDYQKIRYSLNIDDDLDAVFDDDIDAPIGGLKESGIRGEDVLKEGEEALGSIHISAADTARPVQQSVFDGETADMRDKMRARYNERMIIARKDLRQQRHAEHCARDSRSIKAFRSF